ncbi:MAG TPA: hypothetical protein PKH10_13980, partial [bacterium]|nr:hypothetical protein [bacterium]
MKHVVGCLGAVAFFLLVASCGDESAQKTSAGGTLSLWEEQRDEPLYGMEEATQEAWLVTVQKRLATGEYRISASDNGFRATNRAQGLRFLTGPEG